VSAPRVALIDDEEGTAARLAASLAAGAVEATVLRARPLPLVDALLERRGFTGPLGHAPGVVAGLVRGRFDVAHAFTATDAAAALAWRRLLGGAVVFTCVAPLDRSTVADRRLRLQALRAAVEDTDAVRAADDSASAALERWMAVDAPVLGLADATAHAELYAALATARAASSPRRTA
jgi:hypothetical protein